LTDDFIDVIAAMMEKDPKRRLQNATDVIQRLAPWAKDSVAAALQELGYPAAATAALRPILPALSDTQPGLFDELPLSHLDESPSQISQRTDPVASAGHETQRDIDRARNLNLSRPEPEFSKLLLALILVPLLLTAGLLVASMLLKALHEPPHDTRPAGNTSAISRQESP
jgi:eukaryotic-like serine/threonine-protein kinase